MREKLRRIVKILGKILMVLLVLVMIFLSGTTIWNKVSCIKENKALKQVGRDVNVNGKNIRVLVTGEGKKTIVLLSGAGTPSPIIDFKPLADKLSRQYRVVILEYAGYGLSDDSNEERTNKAVVEEIRGTLKQLKIEPPYILMPHSVSGVYSLQYMHSYPKEVEAMIGIDSTVPNLGKYGKKVNLPNAVYFLTKFVDATGLKRLSNVRGADIFNDMKAGGNYSEEDIENIIALVSRKTMSKAQLSERRLLFDNLKELYDVKYPDNIPVMVILSNKSNEMFSETAAKQGFHATWGGLHEEVISNPKIQKIVYMDGEHYLHWKQTDAIADKVNEFIQGKYLE